MYGTKTTTTTRDSNVITLSAAPLRVIRRGAKWQFKDNGLCKNWQTRFASAEPAAIVNRRVLYGFKQYRAIFSRIAIVYIYRLIVKALLWAVNVR